MPTYLLDTCILLRHLRGQRAVVRLMRGLGGKNRPQHNLTLVTLNRADFAPLGVSLYPLSEALA